MAKSFNLLSYVLEFVYILYKDDEGFFSDN